MNYERSQAEEWFKNYKRPDRYFVPAGEPIVLHQFSMQEMVAMLQEFERHIRGLLSE